MDLEALRELATEFDFESGLAGGVDATIARPLENPVASRIVWLQNVPFDAPVGREYGRVGARRSMAIRRSDFSDMPTGTIVTAIEKLGSDPTEWQVHGIERVTRSHFIVSVVPRNSAN